MDYLDKDTFERYIDKAFEVSTEERNNIYHKILSIIDIGSVSAANGPAATEITLLFVKMLQERKDDLEYKAAEKSEGNLAPGTKGVFRRIG
jgi:hypothetical protein